jgi:hypothetical protein
MTIFAGIAEFERDLIRERKSRYERGNNLEAPEIWYITLGRRRGQLASKLVH